MIRILSEIKYLTLRNSSFLCKLFQLQCGQSEIQASFILKKGGGVVDCCRVLGFRILCSCSHPHRSGHNIPVNLEQDKCYSLFYNFFSLHEWKSIIPLKSGLEHELSCVFQSAVAAAKSLQSCPTLCDPMDCSLPGFSVHGILQTRTLEWVAISFSIFQAIGRIINLKQKQENTIVKLKEADII